MEYISDPFRIKTAEPAASPRRLAAGIVPL